MRVDGSSCEPTEYNKDIELIMMMMVPITVPAMRTNDLAKTTSEKGSSDGI